MDNSVRQQGSDVQQPDGFLAISMNFFDHIEKWLTGFFKITQAEQKNAGIQLPKDQHHE